MANHDGPDQPPGAGVSQLAAPPPMPNVPPDQLSRSPQLLLGTDKHRSLGWQDHRQAGPSFVVIKETFFGSLRVTDRFPLTEQGWASAWRALAAADPSAAAALAAGLERRAARQGQAAAVAALDDQARSSALRAKYSGGSGDVRLAKDQLCDLRFLDDRLMVCRPGSADAILEVPYQDAETAEILSGPGLVSLPSGAVLALTLAAALLGAWLGFVIHGRVGLAFGALIVSTLGALITVAPTRTETIIQIATSDAEYFFTHQEKGPVALRIELSAPFMAIRAAQRASR